jgi:putative ABC transport system permease protein
MIQFLFKGIYRDWHRSLFPILIVTIGVTITVLVNCWLSGVLGDMVDFNARFSTGHLKVVTRAYLENMDQLPNDLALINVSYILDILKKEFPEVQWVQRIHFAGIVDIPDQNGETRSQGPAIGMAVDLLSKNSTEIGRLNISNALIQGSLPKKRGEVLLSDEFASKLNVKIGESLTLIGSTMYGSMAMKNFILAGTVQFGIGAMDRGALIVNISDAQLALDMSNATGEILGYFNYGIYDNDLAKELLTRFNSKYSNINDEFSPVMIRLTDQNEMAGMLDYISDILKIGMIVFVLVMSIVLWNAGLIGGLRRYGEMGIRLAIGEDKGHVYRSLIYESILIGAIGSVFGTLIGLGLALILQTKGINIGSYMKNSSMMFPNVLRAHITSTAYYIGFFPGLLATVLGAMLSGLGIYKRKTAQLFKELEV